MKVLISKYGHITALINANFKFDTYVYKLTLKPPFTESQSTFTIYFFFITT